MGTPDNSKYEWWRGFYLNNFLIAVITARAISFFLSSVTAVLLEIIVYSYNTKWHFQTNKKAYWQDHILRETKSYI